MRIVKEILIHAGLSEVYQCYADLKLWPKILEDVQSVEILYQYQNYQKFSMTVTRPNGLETVVGHRCCVKEERIELSQEVPPPGFKSMQGIWLFSAVSATDTKVEAAREFEALDKSMETDLQNKINFYLEKNLSSFKEYIENGKHKAIR